MKTKHTHTGTCQACGAVQAVDNVTRLIAKHGYKVAGFGFFNGVCRGSDHKPAEFDITLTHRIMINCEEWAVNADRLTALYASGDLMVISHEVNSGRRDAYHQRIYITVPMFGCSDLYIDDKQQHAAFLQTSEAANARAHAAALVKHVISRFGRELYPVKAAARTFAIGDVVKTRLGEITLVKSFHSFRNSTIRGYRGTLVDPTLAAMSGVDTYYASLVELRKYNK